MLLLAATLFFSRAAVAQRAPATDEQIANEVNYKAQTTIRQLEDLLNTLSNKGTPDSYRQVLKSNSYDSTVAADYIFLNKKVIVEDDTDPARFSYRDASDRDVDSYLVNLINFYAQSLNFSIKFDSLKLGKVKVLKGKEVYIRVYFESKFGNASNVNAAMPYRKTQRVATLKAIKIAEQWQTIIVGISFYQPGDEAEFFPGSSFGKTDLNPLPDQPQPAYSIAFEQAKKGYKRGKTYTLKWQGAPQEEAVKVELYRGQMQIKSLYQGAGKSTYAWTVPTDLKVGGKYEVRLTPVKGPASAATITPAFAIRRKIPFVLRPLAAGIVVYVVWKLLDGPPPGKELPEPNLELIK